MTPQEERKLLSLVTETHAAVVAIGARVADHETILDGPAGNGGSPGLRTRVTVAEKDIQSLRLENARERRARWKIALTALGALFGVVAAWVKSAMGW